MKIFKGKNKFEHKLIAITRIGLNCIGLENSFDEEKRESLDVFDGNLKYDNKQFLYLPYAFKNFVIDELPKYKEKINNASASALYRSLIHNLTKRIISREHSPTDVLNKYLEQEDVYFAEKFIKDTLKKNSAKYKVLLFTDLVILHGPKKLKIGNISLNDVDDGYIQKLPKNIEGGLDFSKLFPSISSPLKREALKGHTALEININGFHLSDELSSVFEHALTEFKTLFSFLHVCDTFLGNAQKGFEIKKETVTTGLFVTNNQTGYQKYFIHEIGKEKAIIQINTRFEKLMLSREKIIITNETVTELMNKCHLGKFNQICIESQNKTLPKKILRSLDWFLRAIIEEDNTDSALDYFISLETLFSTGESGTNSHIIAENVSLLTSMDLEKRIENYAKYRKLLDWRNKIIHHGKDFEENKNCWEDLLALKIALVWSLMGIIREYDFIIKCETKSNAINKYFQTKKLRPK